MILHAPIVALKTEHSPEWRRELHTTALCVAGLAVAWVMNAVAPQWAWIAFAFSFGAGMWHPIIEAWEDIRQLKLDVDFLMLLVAVGAWALGHPSEGATLLILFGASRAMESFAEARTRSAIQELTKEFPSTAMRLIDGKETQVYLEDIAAGDLLVVRPGERFPVDAKLVIGKTTVDLSAINGEEEPLEAEMGTEVPSGGVNGLGLVTVEAIRPACESAYQKIMQLIESAPERRAPAQVISDRVGRYFTMAILSASVLGFLYWWRVASLPFNDAMYRAMALLVAGSPCALVLSIPSAVLAGISSGARRGILFHGGRGLLGINDVRTLAFDKTGTLSTGEPHVFETTGDGANDAELSAVAAALAEASTHPAARSVRRFLNHVVPAEINDVHEVPGEGVNAIYAGKRVLLGRDPNPEDADSPRVVLTIDGQARVRYLLSETIRPFAGCVMTWLRALGRRVVMLSGDNQGAAERIGKGIGMSEIRGGLRPEDKYRLIEEMGAESPVMMIGDGVNDAPALAVADVAVAMGMRGSAAALAQADVVLMRDRLMDLITAIELSRSTRRVIRQNFTIAIGAASILVVFALMGSLPLVLGVFGHEGGTVLVVLNSLRLLFWKSPHAHAIEHAHLTPSPVVAG